jgi:hypothetical protein
MGQCHTFGAIAGRWSAAHAATLKRLREERCYLRVSANWRAFCNEYLKMSQTQADHIIQLWDEFGAAYFELAQLTRISPETYRALSPTIYNGAVHCNGQAIELSVENSRRVVAVVAELRRSLRPLGRPTQFPCRSGSHNWTNDARGSSRTSRRFPDQNNTATTGCGSPKS